MVPRTINSQEQFKILVSDLRGIHAGQDAEFSGSFSAFRRWLEANQPQIVQRAEEIASDVRLWRDTQDVLRQLWERAYRA